MKHKILTALPLQVVIFIFIRYGWFSTFSISGGVTQSTNEAVQNIGRSWGYHRGTAGH